MLGLDRDIQPSPSPPSVWNAQLKAHSCFPALLTLEADSFPSAFVMADSYPGFLRDVINSSWRLHRIFACTSILFPLRVQLIVIFSLCSGLPVLHAYVCMHICSNVTVTCVCMYMCAHSMSIYCVFICNLCAHICMCVGSWRSEGRIPFFKCQLWLRASVLCWLRSRGHSLLFQDPLQHSSLLPQNSNRASSANGSHSLL